MDFHGLNRALALAHFDGLVADTLSRPLEAVRSWQRLQPEQVIELLSTAAEDVRHEARSLASLLTRFGWRIRLQTPWQGQVSQLASNVREIELAVAGRDYRLLLSEGTRLQLERIAGG